MASDFDRLCFSQIACVIENNFFIIPCNFCLSPPVLNPSILKIPQSRTLSLAAQSQLPPAATAGLDQSIPAQIEYFFAETSHCC